MAKRGHMFTNRRHSFKGKLSACLGGVSFLSVCLIIYESYLNEGALNPRLGAAALFALIFGFVGVSFGIYARRESERFYLFPDLGIFLNSLTILIIAVMFYYGL